MEQMPKWCKRRTCTQVQLQSLTGKLNFFGKVIRAGRVFTRRLIDLIHTVHRPNHHISLTSSAREDLHWWCELLQSWNQASIIPDPKLVLSTDILLFTDAAKRQGFGAILGNSWIQSSWPPLWQAMEIDIKELFAIVAAVVTWGHLWQGRRIVIVTDNKPITQIWSSGSTPAPDLMALTRRLFLFAAQNHFSISFKHILGHFNPVADALSRFQVERFRQLMPTADVHPTAIPETVWDIWPQNHEHWTTWGSDQNA